MVSRLRLPIRCLGLNSGRLQAILHLNLGLARPLLVLVDGLKRLYGLDRTLDSNQSSIDLPHIKNGVKNPAVHLPLERRQ